MAGFFHNLGRRLGHAAIPSLRKSKWIWEGLSGSEEEALRAEAAFGRALSVELRNATEPANDPAGTRLIRELCQSLSRRVRDKRRAFATDLFHDASPNAMALPGGFLFVSDTLLDFCQRDPDQLAFVLGHEMAHVIRGHTWDRMVNETASRAALVITARTGPLGAWLRQKGMALLQSAHSQEIEIEADEMGIRLAAAAQFNPSGGLKLLRTLEPMECNPADLGQYFTSHPPASKRIAQMKKWCRQLAQK